DFSTDLLWFDNEVLTVIGGFYATRPNDVTTTVQIKNQSGTVVFADSFAAPPFVGEINYASLDIGMLPSGTGGNAAGYKVIVKFKQGTKVIGQQFWIPVFPGAARPAGQ